MRTTVIGVGRRSGGDDGAGLAVIDALRSHLDLPPTLALHTVSDPSGLIPLLEQSDEVIIADAVVGAGEPGTVHLARGDQLDASPLDHLSTHGLSVGRVLKLAQAMALINPEAVHIVAVAIDLPAGPAMTLSPAVQKGIERAVASVLQLCRAADSSASGGGAPGDGGIEPDERGQHPSKR